MNRIESCITDSDIHLAEVAHPFNLREVLVEELIWWGKCGCVIAGTCLAGFLCGWGLALLRK